MRNILPNCGLNNILVLVLKKIRENLFKIKVSKLINTLKRLFVVLILPSFQGFHYFVVRLLSIPAKLVNH